MKLEISADKKIFTHAGHRPYFNNINRKRLIFRLRYRNQPDLLQIESFYTEAGG